MNNFSETTYFHTNFYFLTKNVDSNSNQSDKLFRMPGTSETAKIRDNLSELMKRKDVMEQLIEAYRSQGLIGEALVDELGTFSRCCEDK